METQPSSENVAYRLLLLIAGLEDKNITSAGQPNSADRQWVLDTYAQCHKAASGGWIQRGPRREDIERTQRAWRPISSVGVRVDRTAQ